MKKKILNSLGGFGLLLWYGLTLVVSILPLTVLDLPVWADALIIMFVGSIPILGDICWLAIWVISFFEMLHHSPLNDVGTILYFVAVAVYLIVFLIPSIVRAVQVLTEKRRMKKERLEDRDEAA